MAFARRLAFSSPMRRSTRAASIRCSAGFGDLFHLANDPSGVLLNNSPVPQAGISELWVCARPCLGALLGIYRDAALDGESVPQVAVELDQAPTLDSITPSVAIAFIGIERDLALRDVALAVGIVQREMEGLLTARERRLNVSYQFRW